MSVVDGESYNHLHLRDRLGENAPTWRGHSDTETLLACFAAWGEMVSRHASSKRKFWDSAMARRLVLLVSSMATGGSERVAAHLVNAWAARGDLVTLVVTFSGRGECRYPLSEGVTVVYLADITGGQSARRGKNYWMRFWALRRLLRQLRPDAVVSFLTNVNVAALLASLGLQCRLLVSERSFPPSMGSTWTLGALRRITYRWAAGVVMQTQEGLRWLNDAIPEAKGVVIPNPVVLPLPSTEPRVDPDRISLVGRQLLLAVGRLDKGKQFDQLVSAFAVLAPQYPSWDLVILGEGPEGPALRQLVQRLKLDQRVILPGRAGNIGDWYRRADLFAMTSRYEGFPNTLAEAMAHGCAAISYDCDTGPRDIIRHGVDGLLVTPVGHVPALTHALERLMGDEAERTRMATRAMALREHFSMASVLRMWDDLIDATSGEQRYS